MIAALAALLLFQLVGEALVRLAGVLFPGPVLGMLLMFAALMFRREVPVELRNACNGLLGHLSLLFVPAGTGIMLHFARLRTEWLPVVVALFASTLLTIAVTAAVFRLMSRDSEAGGGGAEADGRGAEAEK